MAAITQDAPVAPKESKKKSSSRPLLDNDKLVAEEQKLREKYSNLQIVEGSLRNRGDDPEKLAKWANKRTVVIVCSAEGCTNKRRVATSDLHQVQFCESCTASRRRAAKNEQRRRKTAK